MFSDPTSTTLPDQSCEQLRREDRFEIDDELLDIFRAEADDILAKIRDNLAALASNPSNRSPLWEIRRCAHTFKGASGLAGQKAASQIAHRLEDLLDKLSEKDLAPGGHIIELIHCALGVISLQLADSRTSDLTGQIERLFADIDEQLANFETNKTSSIADTSTLRKTQPTAAPSTTQNSKKVSRVSLERIDELARIGQALIDLQSKFEQEIEKIEPPVSNGLFNDSNGLRFQIESYGKLARRLREKLICVRMIAFGTLAPRLNRAVYVTCEEEEKRAEFVVENGHIELDTEILDFLAEPLLHLLKNAAFHGIEKPETRRLLGKTETGTVKIIVEDDKTHTVLRVVDDGGGISVDKLRRKAFASNILLESTAAAMTDDEVCQFIFIPGLSTAGELNMNAGRGVGMSIVKESVESRGGTISVRSEPGKGTEFTLRIPHASPFSHIIPAEFHKAEPSGLFDVLVVDDSPSIREHTAQTVRNAGWKVSTADNGRQALETLKNSSALPSVILTDLEMPEMNGYDLLAALKTDKRLGTIPIVMITSRADEQYITKAFELGAAAYLTKPLDDANLVTIVSDLLA